LRSHNLVYLARNGPGIRLRGQNIGFSKMKRRKRAAHVPTTSAILGKGTAVVIAVFAGLLGCSRTVMLV
jgi:hypothetical protein